MINNLINITGEYIMNFTYKTKIVYPLLWTVRSDVPMYSDTINPVIKEELTKHAADGKTDGVAVIEASSENVAYNNQPTATSTVKWVDQQSANDWVTYVLNLVPTYYSNVSVIDTSVASITN